ncbi:MAG: hypothetical protein H7343_13630 [Undibacterium sp.]|nr:hypothetical protein [Opitutaceae bacterium]
MANASGAPGPQLTLQDFKAETIRGTTGYFRVGQTSEGTWWFIDPAEEVFFSRGVNGVSRTGATGVAAGRAAKPGAYAAAVDALHGTHEPQVFVETVLVRLNAWRCNTLGAWTTPEFFDRGTAFLEMLDFRGAAPVTTIKLAGANVPDVFDPRWADACERRAEERCGPRALSRDLIGYFTDNEPGWAQPSAEAGIMDGEAGRVERPSLLQICLSLEPGFPAYHAAWEFTLAAHGGELATLARAWGAALPNKEALRQLTLADTALLSAGYLRDQERFTREFARRYFAVTAAAIRRHDPNHLILGCRFGGEPEAAILAECVAPNVDVLSLNPDYDAPLEGVETCHRAHGMPVLLGEFGWAGEAFTKRPRPDEPRGQTTVERMLARGRAGLERVIAHPAVVGYAWPRWADRAEQQPPFAEGLVHIDDHEAREHTELLTDINDRVARLRIAATDPVKP